MKSALHVIAEISEKNYLPVQVSTPERSMNPHRENKKEYDVVYYWKNNLDNEEEFFENRCAEVECENLTVLLKRDMIKKFVKSLSSYPQAPSREIRVFPYRHEFRRRRARRLIL